MPPTTPAAARLKAFTVVFPLLTLAGCLADGTLRAYGAADKIWTLTEARNFTPDTAITLTFPETGRIAGNAPCNSYSATLDVPYPWFDAGPIAATRRVCPALQVETSFFTALGAATLSEVLDNTLILSDEDGMLMVFRADG
jgi:heat shock protein HslJ